MHERHADLLALLRLGIAAVDPAAAVARVVRHEGDEIRIEGGHRMDVTTHVQVLALGKAALAMVTGLSDAIRDLSLYGLAVAPIRRSEVRGVFTLHGSHPVPDLRSSIAGRRLLAAAAVTPGHVPTIILISGGGSALAEVPARGATLESIADVTEQLLRAGATIDEMNVVRRHLSAIKGGGLLRALRGPHVTIALSDVIGSPPHAIASGPTVPDPTDAADVGEIAGRYGVVLPPVERVDADREPQPYVVAADARVAAEAAVVAAAESGHPVVLHTTELSGDAAEAAISAIRRTRKGTMGIFAGETTVTVQGQGSGGRNQHAALVAATEVAGTRTRFAAMGTDGIDGRSPAAGAIVDRESADEAHAAGIDLHRARERFDSYTALKAIGAAIVTGPTGTNVGDLWIVDKT